MVKCPECGESNNRSNSFCGKCGAKLPEPKYCLFCDKKYFEKDFCTKCGSKLISKKEYEEKVNEANKLKRNAQRTLDDEEYNLAMMYCDASIKIKPTEYAWVIKGFCFYNLNKFEEGIECYDVAIRIMPKSFQAHYFKAKALLVLSKYDDAFDCFEIAHKINPHSPLPLIGKANVCSIQKKYNAEIKYLNEALSIDSNNSMCWNDLGDAYLHIKEFKKGLYCCDEALNIDSKNFNAWFTKGEIYFELKEYDKALENCMKAKEIYPDSNKLLDFIEKIKEAQ